MVSHGLKTEFYSESIALSGYQLALLLVRRMPHNEVIKMLS